MFELDLNDEYRKTVLNMLSKIKEATALDYEHFPPLILEAFSNYLKALKEYYERKSSSNMIFPNPYMTGRSGYQNLERKRAKAFKAFNGKIAELRKRDKGQIEIRKDFGGSRSNKKYAHYTIKFQKKPFQLGVTINESGLCEYFNHFRPISSRTYQNLVEMIIAIDTIVKKVIGENDRRK